MPSRYRSRRKRSGRRYRKRSYTRSRKTTRRGRGRRNRNSRMLKMRTTFFPHPNYLGDRVIVRFRNEEQFNTKQQMAAFGTSLIIPGNFLPDTAIPSLSTYTAAYSEARVLRSSLRVTFTNIEDSFSKSVGITQMPGREQSGVTPSATVYLSEQPRTKSAYLTPLAGSKSSVTLFNSGRTATSFGTRTTVTAEEDVIQTSSITTPPTSEWNWNVWTQNVSGAGTTEASGTNIRVISYYTIEFMDRIVDTS